ncbi:hypothetical protein BGX26_004713 [Mortierella sp. AD094]|nr:hypothetical protein BGX26_004713 [Mortierella sp. AD094]
MIVSQNQNAFKYWHLPTSLEQRFAMPLAGHLRILKLVMGVDILNIYQGRTLMNFTVQYVHLKHGTFLQSSKDQWATKVHGKGWKGHWIPFKDQSSKKSLQAAHQAKTSVADIGAGCDLVVLAIHGGGMVMGDSLMFLTNYRAWMKELQSKHGIKIGLLSVEYSLSPETPYPGALNECVAAFRHLVEEQGIDPRRIVLAGDSAGGNLCLTTTLKLRDEYSHLGAPAGQVLFSPWVMCPQPLKDNMDDFISNNGGQIFTEAYTQNLAKVQTSQYAAPIRAATLAGLPRMLIFIGGVETLRPSIERFVEKAAADGVQLEVHTKEGMAHDYALLKDISSTKIFNEANEIVGNFMAKIRDEYVTGSVAL